MPGLVRKNDLHRFKASPDEVKAYQELSGKYIAEYMKTLIASPVWSTLSKEDKRIEVLGVVRDMRKNAREQLFPQYY